MGEACNVHLKVNTYYYHGEAISPQYLRRLLILRLRFCREESVWSVKCSTPALSIMTTWLTRLSLGEVRPRSTRGGTRKAPSLPVTSSSVSVAPSSPGQIIRRQEMTTIWGSVHCCSRAGDWEHVPSPGWSRSGRVSANDDQVRSSCNLMLLHLIWSSKGKTRRTDSLCIWRKATTRQPALLQTPASLWPFYLQTAQIILTKKNRLWWNYFDKMSLNVVFHYISNDNAEGGCLSVW